jgi:hypothetical protein
MLSDKEFFLKLKQYIEDVERQIDGEWGNCRSVEQLISDGEMPDLYFQVLQRITSVAPPEPVWTEGICGDGAAILKDGVMQPIEDVIAALNATSLAQPAPEGVSLAHEAYVAFVQICKGNSDDAGTYEADEELVRRALKRLSDLELARPAIEPVPEPEVLTDEELDIVVIAIQRLAPDQPDGPTQPTHDLHAVDRGREILKQYLARFGRY